MITRDEARQYNIKWRIFRYFIKFLNHNFNQSIPLEVLKENENLLLRESDLLAISESEWIECTDSVCTLTDVGKSIFQSWHLKVDEIESMGHDEKEHLYVDLRHSYKEMFEEYHNNRFRANQEIIHQNLEQAKQCASALHWHYLPEYEEYIISNRGVYPDDTEKYYDHYHTIEDFVHDVEGDGKKITKLGDLNLDQDLEFSVYSRRWGHEDTYSIRRTLNGWKVRFHSDLHTEKDGSGGLIDTLEHDSISYPHDLQTAFENLWDLADKNPMEVEELQIYLNQIAEWVSITEKNVPKFLIDHSIM